MESKSSSKRQRIPISKGGERVIQITKPDPPEEKEEVPAVFTEMQRSMEDELERRRKDWEREVERMQQDFFNLKSPTSSGGGGDFNTSALQLSDEEFDNIGNRNVTVKLGTSPVRQLSSSTSTSSPSTSIIEMNNTRTNIVDRPDGSRLYRLRFDVSGFDPAEVKVKAEGQKLFVSAWREIDHGNGHKSTKQFNRQVDIPESVDPDMLVATVNNDGYLNIEGSLDERRQVGSRNTSVGGGTPSPLPRDPEPPMLSPPQYYSVVRSSTGRRSPSLSHSPLPHSPLTHSPLTHVHSPQTIITESSYVTPHSPRIDRFGRNGSTSSSTVVGGVTSPRAYSGMASGVGGHHGSGNPMVVAVNDVRKLKMAVDVGPEFDPGDVVVKLVGTKIQVHAKHEDTSGGRTCKREFSREYDLPERLEESTMRAVLAPDGRLVIGASVMSNMMHSEAIDSVIRDMPIDGTPVRVVVV